VNQAYGILELLDETGNRVSPGQKGTVVATGLHNLTMPMIRYDTTDRCVYRSETICLCGRRLPQIDSLYGFIEDPIITPDGSHLTGLDTVFNTAWGIKMGQIVQTKKDAIEVRLVKDSSYDDKDSMAILDAIRSRAGNEMNLELVFVNHIEPTEEGKFKWIRSEIQ